jgi:hypothetical protein
MHTKIGGTFSDIEDGLNARIWAAGIARTGKAARSLAKGACP